MSQDSRIIAWLKNNAIPLGIGLVGILLASLYFIDCFTEFYSSSECVTKDAVSRLVGADFRFFRIPHLTWHSDKLLYPYGIDLTFMAWLFELSFFEWISVKVFGLYFPCQWYFIYSLFVVYFGTYFLLRPRKGNCIACLFAFILTFCNYAVLCKFPGHIALSTVHWVVLSVLMDVIAIEKYWDNERFSARFILMRLFLLLCIFGMDIGYIAGIACVSVAFTVAYILMAETVCKRSLLAPFRYIGQLIQHFLIDYSRSRCCNVVLSICVFLAAWVYLPLIMQIVTNATLDGKSPIVQSHPLRVLLPILPGFNAATENTGALARIDTIYAWNAGWTFLIVFVLFLVGDFKRGVRKWLPGVLLLFLFLFMHAFPVLTFFPAFRCCRLTERFSPYVLIAFLMPAYFSLRLMTWNEVWQKIMQKKEIVALLLALFAVEFVTAYSGTFRFKYWYKIKSFPHGYKHAVECVKHHPGEGVFFIPFGVMGGDNNVFNHGLGGKIYDLVPHQMQFAAKCEKKANCVYAGRMPKRHVTKFAQYPWDRFELKVPWDEKMWDGLHRYFQNTDHSAVVVAKDIVNPMLMQGMKDHWGEPTCEFLMRDVAYAVFLLPDEWRGRYNEQALSALRVEMSPILSGERIKVTNNQYVWLKEGFSACEDWGSWGCSTESVMVVTLPKAGVKSQDGHIELVIQAQAFKSLRNVEVFCDDEFVVNWTISAHSMREYVIPIRKSMLGKTIDLRFVQHDLISPHAVNPKSMDTRMLGMGFSTIAVRADPVDAKKKEGK